VFRGATAIIVVSRYLQRRLAHYAAKTQLCAVAFDPSIFASAVPERLESSSARFEVVYAGSISGTEGTHVLLEAVRQLRAECRERVRLFIIGNPAQNETIGEYLAAPLLGFYVYRLENVPSFVYRRGIEVGLTGIGETICDSEARPALPYIPIDPPTIQMEFAVNDGPLAGIDGKLVTARHIWERLVKEILEG